MFRRYVVALTVEVEELARGPAIEASACSTNVPHLLRYFAEVRLEAPGWLATLAPRLRDNQRAIELHRRAARVWRQRYSAYFDGEPGLVPAAEATVARRPETRSCDVVVQDARLATPRVFSSCPDDVTRDVVGRAR